MNPILLRAWGRRLLAFFLGQGAIQALNLLTGFLLVRWLSAEAFAQYSVAFGFQSSIGVLADMGVAGSIVALAGQGGTDPETIGRYTRSAKHLRGWLLALVLPGAVVGFLWLTGRQAGWGWELRLALLGSVLFSLWCQGWLAFLEVPLLTHQRLGDYYRAQLPGIGWRLGASGALFALGRLGAATTAWINSLSMLAVALAFRRRGRGLVAEPARADPGANREMLRYLGPLAPGMIFYALQGQLTLWLITAFGRSQNIAEVAALGRLTQVLLVLFALNGVIISPYVARLPFAKLAGRYVLLAAGATVMGVTLTLFSLAFPSAMLWIIGPRYAHLAPEFPWSIAAWSLNYLGAVLWTISTARKWVFWWHTALFIVTITAVQAVGVWALDLTTTLGIFQFSILTALAGLAVYLVGAARGYWLEWRHANTSTLGSTPANKAEVLVP